MSDGPQEYRRASDYPLTERVTVVEMELLNLSRRFDRYADRSDQLIAKLDSRADRQDVVLARLLAGLTILMFLSQLAAPFVLQVVGVQP